MEAVDPQLPAAPPPLKIGRFTVLYRIGAGGMGVVYACYDAALDRKVAVKVLHLDLLRNLDAGKARLLREAQAMARFSHPNIVTVYEVGHTDALVFIAMEFVRGATLDVWVAQPRTWKAIVSAFLQAGHGLEAAHQAGLVHRDFKPSNVMITDEGRVKVLDFGLARIDDNLPHEASPETPHEVPTNTPLVPLTRADTLLGTPAYMSPEQHLRAVATPRSDQFSFCVSLYQCLYGTLPFATTSLAALRSDVLAGRITPPPPSTVPMRVFKILRRGLAPDPAQRHATIAQLLATLEHDPGALYRRAALVTASAALIGAVSVAATSMTRANEQCPDARRELQGIWDDERAAALATAVRSGTTPQHAHEVLTLVQPRLEYYATTWVHLRNDACLAHAEGRQSAQLFDLRTACLDQRRASLDAVLDSFTATQTTTLANLLQATAKLPTLDPCADAEALTAAVALPDDPTVRAQVQAHRNDLSRAEIFEFTGQNSLGLQIVDTVLADPTTTTYEPLRAEALLRKGMLQMQSGASLDAEQSFTTALLTALATDHDFLAAQTSAKLGYLLAVRLERVPEALAQLPLMTALNQRVRKDPGRYAEFLNLAAAVHSSVGQIEAADQLWEQAMTLLRDHGLQDTPEALNCMGNLGFAKLRKHEYEAAESILQRVIKTSEQVFGSAWATRPVIEYLLARSEYLRGRPHAARNRLLQLLANLTSIENKNQHRFILGGLGEIELADGNVGLAYQRLRESTRVDPENFDFGNELMLMVAAAANGDAATMQHSRDAALAHIGRPLDLHNYKYQQFVGYHGRALRALGHTHEALALLTQAQAGLASSGALLEVFHHADFSRELGLVRQTVGDLDAAERDLQQALAGYQQVLPPHNLELAETLRALGDLALQRHRFDQANTWLTQAESIYTTTSEPDYTPLALARFSRARAMTGTSPSIPPSARTLAMQALDALRANARTPEIRTVESWLSQHDVSHE